MSISVEKWKWQGWAGHSIGNRPCRFHLNTVIGKYIVSTIGDYPSGDIEAEDPSHSNSGRLYETMVFKSMYCDNIKCSCKGYVAEDFAELTSVGYNSLGDANAGHMTMCEKVAEWTTNNIRGYDDLKKIDETTAMVIAADDMVIPGAMVDELKEAAGTCHCPFAAHGSSTLRELYNTGHTQGRRTLAGHVLEVATPIITGTIPAPRQGPVIDAADAVLALLRKHGYLSNSNAASTALGRALALARSETADPHEGESDD